MATTITLTLDDTLTPQEQEDLRNILPDALDRFVTTRAYPEDYVTRRYPIAGAHDKAVFDDKVAQVKRRVALALKLHTAALNQRVEAETPPLAPGHVLTYEQFLDQSYVLGAVAAAAELTVIAAKLGEGWAIAYQDGTWIALGNGMQFVWRANFAWKRVSS